MALATRKEAIEIIGKQVRRMETETAPLEMAAGRTCAAPVIAQLTHPPQDMSAMDGYAVKFAESLLGSSFKVIGEAAAGAPFFGSINPSEAVRVFTGSVVPDGADHIVIQEDVSRKGDTITVTDAQPARKHIRRAGIDFTAGDTLITPGTRLTPFHQAATASANHHQIEVYKRPVVAILASGDELKQPGTALQPGQIISSTPYALASLISAWGGEPRFLGIAPDSEAGIIAHLEASSEANIIVPLGGASVGDHDHMRAAFTAFGTDILVQKIAIRPGKPTWFGACGTQLVLGLPGNPASALVCAHLFLEPIIAQMTGRLPNADIEQIPTAAALNSNGPRETFLRAKVITNADGERVIKALPNQDSSLITPFLQATHLLVRPAGSPAAEPGSFHPCLPITAG
ncbi:MAG: molybdopterin molybdotransferase MoeA [Henriciella sp.]